MNKHISMYNVMWSIMVFLSVRLTYATLEFLWYVIYYNDYLSLNATSWIFCFILFCCYTGVTVIVTYAASPVRAKEFKTLEYKESFFAAALLQTVVSVILLSGFTLNGGLQTVPLWTRITILSWALSAIPFWYFFHKAK